MKLYLFMEDKSIIWNLDKYKNIASGQQQHHYLDNTKTEDDYNLQAVLNRINRREEHYIITEINNNKLGDLLGLQLRNDTV